MGVIDDIEWNNKRVLGCMCRYCDGCFYSNRELILRRKGADYESVMGTSLPDGVVFYYDGGNGKPYRVWKAAPGCFKQHPENDFAGGHATLGGWNKDEYTLVPQPEPVAAMSLDAPPGGSNCHKCNQNNPYAAPNRKDGTYVCYQCR